MGSDYCIRHTNFVITYDFKRHSTWYLRCSILSIRNEYYKYVIFEIVHINATLPLLEYKVIRHMTYEDGFANASCEKALNIQ